VRTKLNFKDRVNKEEFIQYYQELKSARKVAKIYNVDKGTILSYAKSIGFVNQYRPELSLCEVEYIVSQYYCNNARNVSKELKCSSALISKIWMEAGLKGKMNRTYYLNENYFSKIDSADKAYFIGYLAADGCAYKRNNHIGMISIICQKRDKELLEMFNFYLKSNYPIHERDNKYTHLQINSEKLYTDLSKYNIIDRKTWTYTPSFKSDDLFVWHFIRGYFDGDGSIYSCPTHTGRNYIVPSDFHLSLCGNKATMIWFYNTFKFWGIDAVLKQDRKERYSQDFYYVRVSKLDSLCKLYELLYKDSSYLRLERKYNKFNDFLIKLDEFKKCRP
jgi:hypothetical protein